MKIVQEFKQFAMRGNMIDMAVGIIIGAAFAKIVSSLVADVLMPPLGLLIGGTDFTGLKILLKPALMEGSRIVTPAVTLNYGNFIQVIVDFLIVAFAIFMMIKVMNRFYKKQQVPPTKPTETPEQLILSEIRDILKTNGKVGSN
jgi:large conductance mechanosensitive channel